MLVKVSRKRFGVMYQESLKYSGPFGLVIPFLRIYPVENDHSCGERFMHGDVPEALFITVEN